MTKKGGGFQNGPKLLGLLDIYNLYFFKTRKYVIVILCIPCLE